MDKNSLGLGFVFAALVVGVGSSPASVQDPAEKALTRCLNRAAVAGSYSSLDGGRSARTLLEKACRDEYSDWIDACEKARTPQRECIVKAAILAQAALKLTGK